MNYCSNCGHKVALAIPEGDSLPRFVCGNCGAIHYQNPKIIVGTLAVFEGKVLLCRRAIEPRKGLWNLPAGFMENGETAEEGARRETLEEACVHVEIERLHVVYSIPHFNQVYLHFLAKLPGPDSFSEGPETLESRLFEAHEVPWDDIAFSSTQFALKRFFEGSDTPVTHLGTFDAKSIS